MAQGDGDGVGGVIGLGQLVQPEQALCHVHDLTLGGVAVAHHRLLDLGGLVGGDLQPRLADGQQNHPPALGHADAGGDVLTEKEFLNGHGVGPGGPEELAHILVDHLQPGGKIHARRGGDGAAPQQPGLAPRRLDQPEAGDAVARINSQNPHQRPPLAMLM